MKQESSVFDELYQKYSKDVYRFAYWLSGNADDAKDITSETFVRVWTSENEIRFETVKSYLFAIARNQFLKNQRRKKWTAPMTDDMLDTSRRPDEIAEVQGELEETMKAVQSLPEIDRTVLIMRAQDGMSYEEIASLTGLSLSAVKVKVFRARKQLFQMVSHRGGENR